MADFVIRPVTAADRGAVRELWENQWGGELMVVRGEVYHASDLPGFLAWQGSRLAGLVTYFMCNDTCEIISLDSLVPGQGIGTALLEAVTSQARREGRRRVRVVTTNDNTRALGFYQKHGYVLVALRPGAVAESRKMKPTIPFMGEDGIPIRDELELELRLE